MSKGPFYNKPLAFRELGYEAAMRSPAHKVHDNLWSRADIKTRTCFPSYRQIMEDTGLGRVAVHDAIRELKGLGLIKVKQERWEESQTFKANEYQLIIPTKPCPKKPKRKRRSVTVNNGDGYKRDSEGRFRGSVTVNNGGSVPLNNGGSVTVNNGDQHNPSEHNPSEHKQSISDSQKSESPSPLNGFEKSKAKPKTPQDKKPKLSPMEVEGDELSAGVKPPKGVLSLSVESLRELLRSKGPEWLRDYLIKRGYDPQEIEGAIEEAKAPEGNSPLSPRAKEKRRGSGPGDAIPPPGEGEEWGPKYWKRVTLELMTKKVKGINAVEAARRLFPGGKVRLGDANIVHSLLAKRLDNTITPEKFIEEIRRIWHEG